MNQKDIDLVQELEAEEAARAEAVPWRRTLASMHSRPRRQPTAKMDAVRARARTTSTDHVRNGSLLMPVYCSTSRKVTDLRAHRLTLIKAAIVQYLRVCSASQ